MPTIYTPTKTVQFGALFDRKLQGRSVYESFVPGCTTTSVRCLSDGANSVWVYASPDGLVANLKRYGANAATNILAVIADVLETDFIWEDRLDNSELGVEEERWQARELAAAKKYLQKLQSELLRYVRGEPNNIRPGSTGMTLCRIAKRLVVESPDLGLPALASLLLAAVWAEYETGYAVKLTLAQGEAASGDGARQQNTLGLVPRVIKAYRSRSESEPLTGTRRDALEIG
jgi:hypothetical protein